ncbi:uroporphyrinogen-III synthase [Proteobacteria bacterium 005FR1]|nr:uroporphyrinogen-III synthase [Proteobacteria bacterium 005FR1]
MNNLQGLAIVITRPRAQALKWQKGLQAMGASTYLLPILEIAPVSDSAAVEAVKTRILALADYDKIIFVSQNAVQHAMDWIDRYWPQLPVGIRYFAVGGATAAAAREWGLEITAADEAMNSEALLALSELQAVENEKILICRGLGGRTHLGEQLFQRGAQVDYCELYERRLPASAEADVARLAPELIRNREAGSRIVIAVHSGESLQNLSRVLKRNGNAELKSAVLLVPGARVAELASSLGFRHILVAENATDEAMTRALLEGL